MVTAARAGPSSSQELRMPMECPVEGTQKFGPSFVAHPGTLRNWTEVAPPGLIIKKKKKTVSK